MKKHVQLLIICILVLPNVAFSQEEFTIDTQTKKVSGIYTLNDKSGNMLVYYQSNIAPYNFFKSLDTAGNLVGNWIVATDYPFSFFATNEKNGKFTYFSLREEGNRLYVDKFETDIRGNKREFIEGILSFESKGMSIISAGVLGEKPFLLLSDKKEKKVFLHYVEDGEEPELSFEFETKQIAQYIRKMGIVSLTDKDETLLTPEHVNNTCKLYHEEDKLIFTLDYHSTMLDSTTTFFESVDLKNGEKEIWKNGIETGNRSRVSTFLYEGILYRYWGKNGNLVFTSHLPKNPATINRYEVKLEQDISNLSPEKVRVLSEGRGASYKRLNVLEPKTRVLLRGTVLLVQRSEEGNLDFYAGSQAIEQNNSAIVYSAIAFGAIGALTAMAITGTSSKDASITHYIHFTLSDKFEPLKTKSTLTTRVHRKLAEIMRDGKKTRKLIFSRRCSVANQPYLLWMQKKDTTLYFEPVED